MGMTYRANPLPATPPHCGMMVITMKPILALVVAIMLVPAIALADKEFEDSGTHDCGTDPVVNIVNGGGTYTLTGACTQVNVNGGTITGTFERVDELNVNGDKNKVTVTTLGAVNINGLKNSVKWKKATTGKKPKVATNGKGNSVVKVK